MTVRKRKAPPKRKRPFPLKKSKLIDEYYAHVEIYEVEHPNKETEIVELITRAKK